MVGPRTTASSAGLIGCDRPALDWPHDATSRARRSITGTRCSTASTRRDVRARCRRRCARGACASATASSVRSCGRSSSTPPTRRACTRVAETLWTLGERVARRGDRRRRRCSPSSRSATTRSGWRGSIPATRRPAPRRAPTRSSCPTRCSSPSTTASRPPAPATARGWRELFDGEPLMARFRERFDARFYRPVEALLEALVASYREWGGTASPPRMAIVDWREVPTFSEFEILRDAFTALGVPTIICDPRDLEFESAGVGRPAPASTRTASASTSSTAASSSTTSSRARPSAARCSTPTQRAPSASPTRCAARSRTRRRSSPC